MAYCESTACGRRIEWVPSAKNGRKAPLDPVPVDNGNVVIERGRYRVLTKAEVAMYDSPGMFDPPPPDRFTLHFATCPDAEHYRRCKRCHKSPCQCKGAR